MAIVRKKFREIDFTHEEFCNHFSMNKDTFPNKFSRFNRLYKMDKKKFKFEADANGKFFWPAEWAEVAGVLIKFIQDNPIARKNFDGKKVTSKEICEYYQKLTDYVEEEMPTCFQNIIKSLRSYYVAKVLLTTIPVLEQRMAEFIAYHLLYDKKIYGTSRHIDTMVRGLSEQIDKEIFENYRSDYSYFCSREANKKKFPRPRKDPMLVKPPSYAETIEYTYDDLPLDFAIAKILKQLIDKTSYMNTWDNDSRLEWENKLHKICKEVNSEVSVQEISDFIEELKLNREKYYEFMNDVYPKNNSGMYGFMARFMATLSKSELRTKKEEAIDNLEILKNKPLSDDQDEREKDELEQEVLRGYIKFTDDIRQDAKKYEELVQLFVGQLLLPYIGEDL